MPCTFIINTSSKAKQMSTDLFFQNSFFLNLHVGYYLAHQNNVAIMNDISCHPLPPNFTYCKSATNSNCPRKLSELSIQILLELL